MPATDDFYTEPPNTMGQPIRLGMVPSSDFVGKLVVNYGLACTPPGGVKSGANYVIELYVGVPIPVQALAATGPDARTSTAPTLAGVAMLAAGGMLAFGASRRRRASR